MFTASDLYYFLDSWIEASSHETEASDVEATRDSIASERWIREARLSPKGEG